MNQDTHTDRHKWSKIKKRVRFSPELKIFFFRQLEKTKLFSDLWPHHIFDNAPFAPCFWWSKLFPCTIILCSVTSALFQVASKHADVVKNCVVASQQEISSPLRSACLSLTLTVRGSTSSCVCYLCVMISGLSYSGWEWLMLLQHHALASGVPHESLLGPTLVKVGFARCSWGTVRLITRWDFHWFKQSFITTTRNGEILMRLFWVRGQAQCACVSMRERVCVWGGFVFIGYVLICLSGRAAGFLPRWSNGFSSAWWTSSGLASPSASPRSEVVPPGSQLDGNTNTERDRERKKKKKKEKQWKTDRKQKN